MHLVKPDNLPTGRTKVRMARTLQTLKLAVRHGRLAAEELPATLKMAVEIRDDRGSTKRERLHAGKLIEEIRAKGIDVAMYLHKLERVDGGQANERTETTHVIRVKPPRLLTEPRE